MAKDTGKTTDTTNEETDAPAGDMDFDLAFGEATGPETTPVTPPADTDVTPPPAEEEPSVAEETTPAEGDTPPAGEEEEAPPAAAETPPAEEDTPPAEPKAPEAPATDPALAARIAELEAKLAAKTEEKPAEPAEPEKPKVSQEEQEALDDMEKEWPGLSLGVETKLRLMQDEMKSMVQGAMQEMMAKLEPALKTVGKVENNTFMSELTKLQPQVDALYPKVDAWVNTLPEAVKKAYNTTLDTGSAEEVSSLFDMYKKLHGVGEAPPAADSKPPATNPPREGKPEADKKLSQLTGVKRERTGITAETDVNDFSSAFERAAQG